MDFDKIKSAWQDSFKEESLNDEQIRAKLKIKARSAPILKKIMHNYRYGLIVMSFMYFILITGLFIFLESYPLLLIATTITALFIIAFSYSYGSLRKIQQANTYNDSVITGLKKTIPIMERSLRFGMGNLYKYLLIPLALITGIVIGIFIGAGERSFMETVYNLETRSIIKIILVILLGTSITIPVSQYMMKQMYKQHLDELKNCLKELEETITN